MVAVFNLHVTKVLLLSIIFFTCQLFYLSKYNIQYLFKNRFYYYLCNQKSLFADKINYVHNKNLAFKRLKFLQNVF